MRRALRGACINPTPENRNACGPNYFFPQDHLQAGAQEANAVFKKKVNSSNKVDTNLTSRLNSTIR
jgi:hypothetical protein